MILKIAMSGGIGGLIGLAWHSFPPPCEGSCPAPTTALIPVLVGVALGIVAAVFSAK
jgi:hypothetical protein